MVTRTDGPRVAFLWLDLRPRVCGTPSHTITSDGTGAMSYSFTLPVYTPPYFASPYTGTSLIYTVPTVGRIICKYTRRRQATDAVYVSSACMTTFGAVRMKSEGCAEVAHANANRRSHGKVADRSASHAEPRPVAGRRDYLGGWKSPLFMTLQYCGQIGGVNVVFSSTASMSEVVRQIVPASGQIHTHGRMCVVVLRLLIMASCLYTRHLVQHHRSFGDPCKPFSSVPIRCYTVVYTGHRGFHQR